ncbi:MAG: biotin-dependent carboxyltransferase family protein [Paracoccaceae bacterium]
MTHAVFRVAFAGPHVSVQDAGRYGLMRFGVPASGPMDRKSFAIANAALGNPPDQAGIEVSAGGVSLDCLSGQVSVAVAGGGFIVRAGARMVGSWTVLTISAGDTLTIRPGPWGNWTYLAFAGILQAESWLGSKSTHGASGLGGGRLATAQLITVTKTRVQYDREGPIPCPVWARPRHILRCVPGPQDRFFSTETLAEFTSSRYFVTDAFDRMGVKLRGPALPPISALAIPSEPILRGAVQVSGDGVLTVLLSDHQTTGGYPKIATVIAQDLDSFVQCRPGDAVAFTAISPMDAVLLARTDARRGQSFLERLTALSGHPVTGASGSSRPVGA